ncbi:RNA polymerase sigma factor [Mucilaginibacter inviolabilis]|uniref:RNA polymerase sigma factor n=1 Tax=Mucilaginibacter inviolabilis TaxID=2714892 RepID=UPI00293BD836|nr:RNA polymerase sigma-70 factor [Mucilaginibacter inviolabilis]
MKLLETPAANYVSRLKNSDQVAFRELYDIYGKRLYNFTYRFLKSKEQSEEMVQESFLNLWINREKLKEEYPIGPYLFTIGRRLTLNSMKKAAASKEGLERLWASITELHNEAEEQVILNSLQAFAASALNNLPPQQQLVFRMSREEGLSYEQIAERLQISRNTVKNHLVAALKNMKGQFAQSDVGYFMLLSLSLYYMN